MNTNRDGLRVHGLGYTVPVDTVDASAAGARLWVLRHFDLTLEPGEQVALLGPSGSGKSTLLNLLAGLDVPDEGRVGFGEADISAWPAARREAWRRSHVGLVFQQFHLFDELSALDNVLLPWTFDHVRVPGVARKRCQSLLDTLGVPAGSRCRLLSRGEQQRVAVARALARQPRLVLADEPTASLDAGHAARACGLLQQVCREQGASLVVATHDPAIAQRFARSIDLATSHMQS